jgi:predicted Ser/Thr protein kinase
MAEMFVNKSEVKHVGLEGMSRDQLEKRLSELEQKIGESKDIVNVTPKETT